MLYSVWITLGILGLPPWQNIILLCSMIACLLGRDKYDSVLAMPLPRGKYKSFYLVEVQMFSLKCIRKPSPLPSSRE